jgi:hypothetical protein
VWTGQSQTAFFSGDSFDITASHQPELDSFEVGILSWSIRENERNSLSKKFGRALCKIEEAQRTGIELSGEGLL